MDPDCNERWAAHRREHELESRIAANTAANIDAHFRQVDVALSELQQERGKLLWRSTYEAAHEALRRRIDELEQQKANLEGRFWALGVGLTLTTLAINVVLHWLVPASGLGR